MCVCVSHGKLSWGGLGDPAFEGSRVGGRYRPSQILIQQSSFNGQFITIVSYQVPTSIVSAKLKK